MVMQRQKFNLITEKINSEKKIELQTNSISHISYIRYILLPGCIVSVVRDKYHYVVRAVS